MDDLLIDVTNQVVIWSPRIVAALCLFVLFYFFSSILKKIILKASKKVCLDHHLSMLLARFIRVVMIVFGFITALGTLGVDITALVAGRGLTGFALGFALKDTISNLLSGVMILLYRPFGVGDKIKVSGYEGTVVIIDLRYTELESEGQKILIPNAKLFTNPVVILV